MVKKLKKKERQHMHSYIQFLSVIQLLQKENKNSIYIFFCHSTSVQITITKTVNNFRNRRRVVFEKKQRIPAEKAGGRGARCIRPRPICRWQSCRCRSRFPDRKLINARSPMGHDDTSDSSNRRGRNRSSLPLLSSLKFRILGAREPVDPGREETGEHGCTRSFRLRPPRPVSE